MRTVVRSPAERTFATRAEADRYLAEQELRLRGGGNRDPRAGNVTFEDWSRRWLESSTHLKPKSRVGYESLLRSTVLPTFGRRRLRDLEPLEVREWAASLTRRGLSPTRVRQSYRLLSQLCDAAVVAGILATRAGLQAPAMRAHAAAAYEEAFLPQLLADLRSSGRNDG